MNQCLALRIDDIGASSKRFEVYGNTTVSLLGVGIPFPLANFLWFKYVRPFKKWGPYREMHADEWLQIFALLQKCNAKLTIGITASWVQGQGNLVPFPVKFPRQAAALKEGVEQGLIEIANHGLTHCVTQNNAFRPRLFSGNRRFHREFWDWVPLSVQEEHIKLSQQILHDFFKRDIVSFVPPGNICQDQTLRIAKKYGIRYVSYSNIKDSFSADTTLIPEENVVAFHDRDIIFNGISWLAAVLEDFKESSLLFLREIGERLER